MKFYSIKPTKPKKGEGYLSIDEELMVLKKERRSYARVCGGIASNLSLGYNSRIVKEFKDYMKSKGMTPLGVESPESISPPMRMTLTLILKSLNVNPATVRYIAANCHANRELRGQIEDSFLNGGRTPLVMKLDSYTYKELVAMTEEITDEMYAFDHGEDIASYLLKMGVYYEELSGIKEKIDEVFERDENRIYQATYST